jgi:hypothetical protein
MKQAPRRGCQCLPRDKTGTKSGDRASVAHTMTSVGRRLSPASVTRTAVPAYGVRGVIHRRVFTICADALQAKGLFPRVARQAEQPVDLGHGQPLRAGGHQRVAPGRKPPVPLIGSGPCGGGCPQRAGRGRGQFTRSPPRPVRRTPHIQSHTQAARCCRTCGIIRAGSSRPLSAFR